MLIKTALYLLVLLLPWIARGQAQWGKAQVVSRFKSVDYNPDSTIRSVKYHSLRFKYRNYGIDYDTLGRPLMIGKYRHGLKEGGWLCADGSGWDYHKGRSHTGWIPGCGTGRRQARGYFAALYEDLTK